MIWFDHGWGWWGWLAMVAGMLLLWGPMVWVVVALMRGSTPAAPDAEQVLAERFARGELDGAEYHQRLDTLRTGRIPAARR